MTPAKSTEVLKALLGSIGLWVTELEDLEKCCPAKAAHLLAAMRQAQRSLSQMIERDREE